MKEVLYEKFDVCQNIDVFIIQKTETRIKIGFENMILSYDIGKGHCLIPFDGSTTAEWYSPNGFDYKRFLTAIKKRNKYYL